MADVHLYGTDLFGNAIQPPSRGKLSDDFLVPPFSVLNTREGWWQERKQAWLNMGIEGEVGRSVRPATGNVDERPANDASEYSGGDCWKGSARLRSEEGRKNGLIGNWSDFADDKYGRKPSSTSGTSVFDPTLTELINRWFGVPQGQIVDPFAGGSVRGIVAHVLGYRYWGCDLRSEQIEANEVQGREILPDNQPVWVCGDSRETLPKAPRADLIFSCPPYGNLEQYSDDPRDLSTMEYRHFIPALSEIIALSCERLYPNRFAVFVVGDFRDSDGFYVGFPADVTAAFRKCGLRLYNEAILVTPVGSLAIRAGGTFGVARKLGRSHQNVMVYCKGDPEKAARAVTRK
jgi:hypothetical protein